MWYDSSISDYGDLNYEINKKYCEKHNIEILKCNKRRYTDRACHWERIPLILKYINNYDYVIWIDSDAYFYIDSKNILDIIKNHSNSNFIFSKDIEAIINSGIFIVKNTKYSINFLKVWGYNKTLLKINPHPIWEDNGVLIDMYNKNILNIRNESIIIYYGFLQHFFKDELDTLEFKPLIFHLAGRDRNTRITESNEYYNKINKESN